MHAWLDNCVWQDAIICISNIKRLMNRYPGAVGATLAATITGAIVVSKSIDRMVSLNACTKYVETFLFHQDSNVVTYRESSILP